MGGRTVRSHWAGWVAAWSFAIATIGGAAAAPPAGPERLTLDEARRLVAGPETRKRATTSLGFTNNGELIHAHELPANGPGYALMGHVRGRRTHFGTDELIAAIRNAAAQVARAFPGSRLAIGNLGFRSGEKIPWSVSHQAGRDADLGMYARTTSGAPVNGLPFVAFGRDGTARWKGQTVVFDTERNLALVRALVEAPGSRVQYLFVARWLKDRLLAEAARQKISSQLIARLGEVMHQPSDSSPHDDHFHLRLFCTIEDRLFGCQDRGPRRGWVEMGDAELAAHIERLGRVLQLDGQSKLARAAIRRLEALRHPDAAPPLLLALGRREADVRKAALQALATTGNAEVAALLLEALPTLGDARAVKETLEVVARMADATLVDRVIAIGKAPKAVLKPALATKSGRGATPAEVAVQQFVVRVLARHAPGPRADIIDLLVNLSRHSDRGVRVAAHDALRLLTCRVGARPADWERPAARTAVTDIAGFSDALRAWDKRLPKPLASRRAVTHLVRATDHRDLAIRVCATRALTLVTGHDVDPFARAPARHRRHWENWWRDNRGQSQLPE
jgi:penicillin-insensitive murein endopeptidase